MPISGDLPEGAPATDKLEAPRALTEAARRALAEAQVRRANAAAEQRPREISGRDGPDPVRYGDWEVKGLATDF